MFEEFDDYQISDELRLMVPMEVLLAVYRVAMTYGGYTVGTPDENLLAEWHNLWINDKVSIMPPAHIALPDWYVNADKEAEAKAA